jgi:SPP1 gp7 family putative phage head morphogenesis protein
MIKVITTPKSTASVAKMEKDVLKAFQTDLFSPLEKQLGHKIFGRMKFTTLPRQFQMAVEVDIYASAAANAPKIATVTRYYDLGSKVIKNDLMEVGAAFRKQGISNMINSATLRAGDALKMKSVEVLAALENGSYTWLRKGFWPTDRKALDGIIRLGQLSGDITPAMSSRWLAMTDSEARLFVLSEEFRKYEKAFSGASWRGGAQMNDPIFRDLASGRKKPEQVYAELTKGTRAKNVVTGKAQPSAVPKQAAAAKGNSAQRPAAKAPNKVPAKTAATKAVREKAASSPVVVPAPKAQFKAAQASLAVRSRYSSNQQVYDALIQHQMNVLRYSSHIQKDMMALLNRTETIIGNTIKTRLASNMGLASPDQWARLNRLSESIQATRMDVWQQMGQVWTKNLSDLAMAEPAIMNQIISNASVMSLQLKMPSARQLNAIINERPFHGRLLKDWISKLQADDAARIHNAIQTGMVMGETAPQIAARVLGHSAVNGIDGVTQLTRKELESIIRTSVQSIANSARQEFLKENEDVIQGEQYVATLDSRTTVECAALDGKVFPIGEGPIPPIHINCRSARVAVLDGEELYNRPAKPTTERQMLDEFTAENNLEPVTSRDALPRGYKSNFDSFQRARVRDLTGQVPANTTYQVWLERQPARFQDEMLGKTKGKLFREGGLTLDKFIDKDASPLSISDLRAKYPEAFAKIT